LFSFTGRTVARQAVRTVARKGGRASKPVRKKTGRYINDRRPYYPQLKEETSYPYAEFVAKELGKYAAESTFDYLYRLNNAHYGGTSQAAVGNETQGSGGIGFSTGNGNAGVADFNLEHMPALDHGAERLQKLGLTQAEITGLLYPVTGVQSNFSSRGYGRTGQVKFDTAFGYVLLDAYLVDGNSTVADVFIQDQVTNRYFKFGGEFR
jgi:hypothetical protein